MNKLVESALIATVGLAALVAAGPTITHVIHALVPLVLVIGLLALGWQIVRYLTRP